MRKAIKSYGAVSVLAVAAADKSRVDFEIPFLLQESGKVGLTDESGNPVLEDGKPVFIEVPQLGICMRSQGMEQFPIWPVTLRLEAGHFHSEQEENRGQLVRGSNFHVDYYDFDTDKFPDLAELEYDDIREKYAEWGTKEFLEAGAFILNDEDQPRTRSFKFVNYWGRKSGPASSGQTGKDYPVFIAKQGVPIMIVESSQKNADGTPGQSTVTDWDKLGKNRLENIMSDVYTLYKWMDIPEDMKADIETITTPDYKGGYTPRTANAPSLIAEQRLKGLGGQATTGLPGGGSILNATEAAPEEVLAGVAAAIPDSDDTNQFEDENTIVNPED